MSYPTFEPSDAREPRRAPDAFDRLERWVAYASLALATAAHAMQSRVLGLAALVCASAAAALVLARQLLT